MCRSMYVLVCTMYYVLVYSYVCVSRTTVCMYVGVAYVGVACVGVAYAHIETGPWELADVVGGCVGRM